MQEKIVVGYAGNGNKDPDNIGEDDAVTDYQLGLIGERLCKVMCNSGGTGNGPEYGGSPPVYAYVPPPPPPGVYIYPASAEEGSPVMFTVQANRTLNTDATFDVVFASNTADAGIDFDDSLISGMIPAGTRRAQISVPTIDDNIYEINETFFALLINVVGTNVGRGTASGTITPDNDPLPQAYLFGDTANEYDNLKFLVYISNGATEVDATINYTLIDGTAVGSRNWCRGGSGDFVRHSASGTVTAVNGIGEIEVFVCDDTIHEPGRNEEMTLRIDSVEHIEILGSLEASGFIRDNDADGFIDAELQ